MNTAEFWNQVKSPEYKVTKPRLAFAEVLVECQDNMYTAETLYEKTKAQFAKTNLSTIYRNLESLEKLDMIYKITTDDGVNLYKLKCADKEHHHHILCTDCGKVASIHYCPLEAFAEQASESGFILTDHRMELYGLCQPCQEKREQKNTATLK